MHLILNFRADAARQKSEALRNLASQLIEEHKDYTKKNELDAEYRLEERNKDVGFWKKELEEEVEAMKKEVEMLTDARRNIDHAAAQTERPLRIYNKCRLDFVLHQNIINYWTLALHCGHSLMMKCSHVLGRIGKEE